MINNVSNFIFFRFRKHREKVAKRKNEGDVDEQSEYQETHQTIKRRISDSELENSSISSSPTSSFEPMDLSGSKYLSTHYIPLER